MTYYSPNESTLTEEHSITPKEEAEHIIEAIRVVRKSESWQKASIIAVVRNQSLSALQAKCKEFQKSQWSFRRKPPICPTSDERLNTAVKKTAKDPKCSTMWVIVVSGLVPDICFAIDANVVWLHIMRVKEVNPGGLLVDGASTWNKTRLDEWPRESHKRKLTHGKGVSIYASDFGSGPWSTVSSDSFDEKGREEIRSYLRQMSDQPMEGSWWERMKEPIASITAISGLVVGAVKAWTVLTCSAKGIFISFKYGPAAFSAGGFTLKTLVAVKVAAPPVAIGLCAAAAVYFVPWDRFFNWLGGWLEIIFTGIWNMICSFWDRLWSMFLDWSGQQQRNGCNCHRMGV